MTQNSQTKRNVASINMSVNQTHDDTNDFEQKIKEILDNATLNGSPARLNFQIIKNSNPNLTKENGLLNLTIPIIPAGYSADSSYSLAEFVSLAKNSEEMIKKAKSVKPEELDRRAKRYAQRITSYIKHEIAQRYAVAKDNHDKNAMKLISSIDLMKGFDFDLYALLLKQPVQILETPKDQKKNISAYSCVFSDGSVVPITRAQHRLVPGQAQLYQRYYKAQNKFLELSQTLESYEKFDISKQKQEATTPTHSVVARRYSATSGARFKKLETEKVSKKKPVAAKAPVVAQNKKAVEPQEEITVATMELAYKGDKFGFKIDNKRLTRPEIREALDSVIAFATLESHEPVLLKFDLLDEKEFSALSLDLPVFPAVINISDKKEMSLVLNKNFKDIAKDRASRLLPAEIETLIANSVDNYENLIAHELAGAYIKAKSQGKNALANAISCLPQLQGYDLSDFSESHSGKSIYKTPQFLNYNITSSGKPIVKHLYVGLREPNKPADGAPESKAFWANVSNRDHAYLHLTDSLTKSFDILRERYGEIESLGLSTSSLYTEKHQKQ